MKFFRKNILVLLILIISLTGCADKNSSVTNVKTEAEKPKYYAPLSGTLTEKDIQNKPIFAVMLDNHPKARPQSSLNEAEIIYEYKVEGEYTRYMALYQKNKPDIIGPVRSARPYFVNTAAEYNAIYTHWGGSEAGYNQISVDNVKDLDGIYLEGSTFYRNKNVKKRAPHNGYTSYDLLYKAADEKGYLKELNSRSIFRFDTSEDLNKVKEEMKDSSAENISLDFFKNAYNNTFIYNTEKNNYSVIRNGENLIDEKDNKEVTPENIIVEFASSKVTGPKLTLTIGHIGEGTGKFFTNGKVIDIKWSKESETAPTIFKTMDDEDIILTPGQTFIQVLDSENDINIINTDNEKSDNSENPKN